MTSPAYHAQPAVGFGDRLAQAVRQRQNPIVVGLDPRSEQLPAGMIDPQRQSDLAHRAGAYGAFCRGIIDVVAGLVAAVKPQSAFFEQLGPPGMQVLADVVAYARGRGLLVLLDGKRSDIGSTAVAYAEAFLGHASPWGADALTVSPYLGGDSLQPFVDVAVQRRAGVFILVKTSNPGGGELQDLESAGVPLYRRVAEQVERWAAQTAATRYGAVGAVVGATYPQQLAELRQAMPHAWLLVPGFGSQGATARDVMPAFDADGLGAVINNSRGIIFAHARPEYRDTFGAARWQEAVEAATRGMIGQLAAAGFKLT